MASGKEVANFNSNGGPQFVNSTLLNCSLAWDERNEESLRCQKWLSTIKHWEHHGRISLLQDSGQWLLNSREYHMWRESQTPSILWLHGIPGSGKSHLVACVLNDIGGYYNCSQLKSQVKIAYFYCSRSSAEAERSVPDEIIRSLLGQLAFRGDDPQQLRSSVENIYNQRCEQAKTRRTSDIEKLSVNECESLLIELIQEQPTILIIDALDEVDARLRYILRTTLRHIIEKVDKSSKFKLFVSSRDDEDIVLEFQGYENIYIRSTDNKKDIERFIDIEIRQALDSGRILGGKRLSNQLREEISKVLITKANGMFRWVSLQIDALCDPKIRSEPGLRNALHSLPESLKESYDVIYNQILAQDSYSKSLAKHTILLLLYSKRKLELPEIVPAAVAGVRWTEHEDEVPPTPQELIGWCCNLVVIGSDVTKFGGYPYFPELTHLSVREYFETNEEYQGHFGHMAVLCSSITALLCRNDKYRGFQPYAVKHWGEHCASLEKRPSGHGSDLVNFFLYSKYISGQKENWRNSQDWVTNRKSQRRSSRKLLRSLDFGYQADAFSAACKYDIQWILEDLSKLDSFDWCSKVNGINCSCSGISFATKCNSLRTIEFILAHSIQPANFINQALDIAINKGYAEAAEILISHGADIKALCQTKNILLKICQDENVNIVKLLIDFGADIKSALQNQNLHLNAFRFGTMNMAKLLIENGADINDPQMEFVGETILQRFTRIHVRDKTRDYGFIEYLISHGAKVDTYDRGGFTPLLIAVYWGDFKLMQVMLQSLPKDEID